MRESIADWGQALWRRAALESCTHPWQDVLARMGNQTFMSLIDAVGSSVDPLASTMIHCQRI